MTSAQSCDILVIGGGPAGSTAAFLLASRGYTVILVDKKCFPRPKLCAGLLTWKTIDLIHSIFHLSAEDLIRQGLISNHTRDYRIYDGDVEIARGRLDFPFHLVDRATYDHFWLQKAEAAGAQTITGRAVRDVDPATGHVALSCGNRIRARVIIGADGVWSIARRTVFSSPQAKRQWNHQLAMTMECRVPHDTDRKTENYAALHFGFVPWGYAWSFPKPDHRIVGIAGLRRRNQQSLGIGFHHFLASIGVPQKALSHNRSHPLPMGNCVDPPGRERVLLVGDACGLADPLLGEGIYYAHRSAQIAAQVITACGPGNKNLAQFYRCALRNRILAELSLIRAFRNLLHVGGRRRRFRGLRLLFRIMPRRLEAAVQGQISFFGLLWPWVRSRRPLASKGQE